MEAYVVDSAEWRRMLGRLVEELEVVGPVERKDQPGFVRFHRLARPEEFVEDYTATTLPPKKAFFPPVEELFTVSPGDPPVIEPVGSEAPFVLAGVHPCDLAAIHALDRACASPPADTRWKLNRGRAAVIGMDCLPDEYCFCASIGTCEARKPCDLFLTPIQGGYLVEVHSDAGKKLLQGVRALEAKERDLEDAEEWRRKKRERMKAEFPATPEEFARLLDQGGLEDVWREVAERCYSCGSCNTVCPACFCFNVEDDFNDRLDGAVRRRTWDSCQLPEFALVAGEHNHRGERWERVRHRWHRKFLYLYKQFGIPFCTGCGRCSRACTADINIVDVSGRLVEFSRKERSHD